MTKSEGNISNACTSEMSVREKNIVLVSSYGKLNLPELNTSYKQTCGTVLSVEELKKIDLKKVDFCDERGENSDCEMNVDKSDLLSDL